MLYPTVWPLPYGITIRTDYSSEHNYAIPRSQTQCWPVQLNAYNQVRITAVHNSFNSTLPNTIRAWLSLDPNGQNVIPYISTIPQNIYLSNTGNSWLYYANKQDVTNCEKAQIEFLINQTHLYYFNIQNCENKDSAYYLKFEFRENSHILIL